MAQKKKKTPSTPGPSSATANQSDQPRPEPSVRARGRDSKQADDARSLAPISPQLVSEHQDGFKPYFGIERHPHAKARQSPSISCSGPEATKDLHGPVKMFLRRLFATKGSRWHWLLAVALVATAALVAHQSMDVSTGFLSAWVHTGTACMYLNANYQYLRPHGSSACLGNTACTAACWGLHALKLSHVPLCLRVSLPSVRCIKPMHRSP